MEKEQIFEVIKTSLIEEVGINEADVTLNSSFYNDLGLESLDMLKFFFGLEQRTNVRISLKEVQGLLQGNIPEEEFFNDDGLITDAGLNHLQKLLPEYKLAEIAGELDQLKVFSLFTVRHLVDLVAEKVQSAV